MQIDILEKEKEAPLNNRTAILLLNLGTPDEPKVKAVRRYLSEFLNDKRVIDLPWILRKVLVNLIIVPFRAHKSTQLYKRLWTDEGSPLLINTRNLQQKLQVKLGQKAPVFFAMRYQKPAIKDTLEAMQAAGHNKILVLPLFPQYASSTTGSAIQALWDEMRGWNVIPSVSVINQFYDHPAFVNAIVQRILSYNPDSYDFVLFSYHGLPTRQTDKTHPGISTDSCQCDKSMPEHGRFCYRATCYETTRLLVKQLGLPKERYATSFQSRLSSNWLKPFTDTTLIALAAEGTKRVLVVAPAFVSDCLETTIEIKSDYGELFIAHGGEELTMVESLNDDDCWVDAVEQILLYETRAIIMPTSTLTTISKQELPR